MSETPSEPRNRLRQAVSAARRGRLDLAREALERLVEEEPQNRDAFALLAAVHFEQGDPGLARAALEEAGVDESAARSALNDARSVMTPDELGQALELGRSGGPLRVLAGRLVSVPSGPTSHARVASALVYDGNVFCQPAPRRRKGHVEPAGDDWNLSQIGGSGRVVLAAPGKPVILDLRDEGVFLREGAVEAFDGPLVFENGRLPGGGPRLVHLIGHGRVAIRARGQLCALRLAAGERAQLPIEALEGFFGGLFVRAVAQAGGEPVTAVCEGEGTLLMRTPAD